MNSGARRRVGKLLNSESKSKCVPERMMEHTMMTGPSPHTTAAGGHVVFWVSCGRTLLAMSKSISRNLPAGGETMDFLGPWFSASVPVCIKKHCGKHSVH